MHRGFRGLSAALVLFTAGTASAVEFNYTWKKGDVHRFQYEDDSKIEMKMPGGMGGMQMPGMQMPGMNMGDGGMSVQMKVQSTFSQKVLAVAPDGTAQVELTLEKMDLLQGGQRLAALNQIPPAARKVKAEVDRKGHARFFRMVTVYVQEGRTLVGVHDMKVGPRGASASMRAGDTRVDVVAAVDPKTGSVSLAMQEKKVPPALKAVKVKAEDPGVDVLPRQLFEMMVLPEGQMEPGSRLEVSTPLGPLATTLSTLEGSVAQLHTTVAQSMNAPASGNSDARPSEDASENSAPAAMGGYEHGRHEHGRHALRWRGPFRRLGHGHEDGGGRDQRLRRGGRSTPPRGGHLGHGAVHGWQWHDGPLALLAAAAVRVTREGPPPLFTGADGWWARSQPSGITWLSDRGLPVWSSVGSRCPAKAVNSATHRSGN